MDVNTPIGGNMPVQSVAVLTTDTLLTSVAAATTGDFTVVFVGTDTGHVKKVRSRGRWGGGGGEGGEEGSGAVMAGSKVDGERGDCGRAMQA